MVSALHCILASIPGRSHHRFWYEIRRGEAWEIRSHAVPSGRHMVDTQRVVPNEECRHPVLYTVRPKAGCQRIRNRYRYNARDGSMRTGIIKYKWLGTAPHVSTICLPDIIAPGQISQAFPAVFHTGSDEILAVGTAWERG